MMPPDLDQALLSNYVGDIASAESLTNTAHDIRNAGYQNHTANGRHFDEQGS